MEVKETQERRLGCRATGGRGSNVTKAPKLASVSTLAKQLGLLYLDYRSLSGGGTAAWKLLARYKFGLFG